MMPAQSKRKRSQKSGTAPLLHEIWEERRPIFKPIIGDVLGFLLILFALAICFLALKALETAGYPKDWLHLLEAAHFWGYFSIFVMFLVDLAIKLFLLMVRRDRT